MSGLQENSYPLNQLRSFYNGSTYFKHMQERDIFNNSMNWNNFEGFLVKRPAQKMHQERKNQGKLPWNLPLSIFPFIKYNFVIFSYLMCIFFFFRKFIPFF